QVVHVLEIVLNAQRGIRAGVPHDVAESGNAPAHDWRCVAGIQKIDSDVPAPKARSKLARRPRRKNVSPCDARVVEVVIADNVFALDRLGEQSVVVRAPLIAAVYEIAI